MTARRIREWPRVAAAVLVVAILLVVIGVVAASASSGGKSGANSQLAALRDRNSHQAAALKRDQQTIAGVRARLAATSATLSQTQAQLARSRARLRCWRQAALHRAKTPVASCSAVS
jgi:septal ring factor EnvC (AmiA/AmiB activator)